MKHSEALVWKWTIIMEPLFSTWKGPRDRKLMQSRPPNGWGRLVSLHLHCWLLPGSTLLPLPSNNRGSSYIWLQGSHMKITHHTSFQPPSPPGFLPSSSTSQFHSIFPFINNASKRINFVSHPDGMKHSHSLPKHIRTKNTQRMC